MANLPLGFALLMGGGVLTVAGISGRSLTDVFSGKLTAADLSSGLSSSSVGSSSAESAAAAQTAGANASGNPFTFGRSLFGSVPNAKQIQAWAQQGLEAAGVPATAENINTIVGRIMQESGGNPNAINLSDSNAAAGHPSQGLLQTIPSTFDTYHVAGTSTSITDPVANVAAAVRYMLARYGHLVPAGPGGY